MKKIYLVILLILMIMVFTVKITYANLVNGSFETNNFTGWNVFIPVNGSADIVTTYTAFGDSLPTITYSPVECSYFALLKTDGPDSYTTISQTVTLLKNDILSGWAAFDARDYYINGIYNDNAHVAIYDAVGNLVSMPWYKDVLQVGNYGESQWEEWKWTVLTDGKYKIEMGVTNTGDEAFDSRALFDFIKESKYQAVPEPSILFILSSAFLLFFLNITKHFHM